MADLYEKVMDVAKRRGFLWPSFEIYGGSAGFYDYGPLGTGMKRRLESFWRRIYCIEEGFHEIETTLIGIESVFDASGHLKCFTDPIVVCKKCGEAFRADHLLDGVRDISIPEIDKLVKSSGVVCPACGGELGDVEEYNLMFSTHIGPGSKRRGYLRPETAQGIFTNFERLLRFYGGKLPFGIVQIGKAFRNEISPRQGVIRLREFTQAELELFVHPNDKKHPNFDRFSSKRIPLLPAPNQIKGEDAVEMKLKDAVENGIIAHEVLGYHIALCWDFLIRAGLDPKKLRFRQHLPEEMAHYAADCWDAEALTERFGWIELVGIADRTDYDIKAHALKSGKELKVFCEYKKPKKKTIVDVRVDMGKLGPLFKEESSKVADAIKKLPKEELEKDKIKVEVDGKTFEVDGGVVEVVQREIEVKGEKVTPHVVEPSFGIDRIMYTLLEHSYYEDFVEGEIRKVLKLRPKLAPIPIAVLPLMSKPELIDPAKKIVHEIRKSGFMCEYDERGFIGKRYRRFDEIGTPYCITTDYQTLEDDTVTIRDRDTMRQVRVPMKEINKVVHNLILETWNFEKMRERYINI